MADRMHEEDTVEHGVGASCGAGVTGRRRRGSAPQDLDEVALGDVGVDEVQAPFRRRRGLRNRRPGRGGDPEHVRAAGAGAAAGERAVALHERRRRGRPLESEQRDPRGDQRPRGERLRRDHRGQRDRAVAAQRGRVGAGGLELGAFGQPEEAGDATRAAAEDRRVRRRLVERAEREHARELRRALHVGTRRNMPPRSDLSRTVTLPPRSTADTSRRRRARWLSMRRRMSRCRW